MHFERIPLNENDQITELTYLPDHKYSGDGVQDLIQSPVPISSFDFLKIVGAVCSKFFETSFNALGNKL